MGCEAACATGELGLRRSIRFIRMATLRTLPRAIARINFNQRHACDHGLVGQECFKLQKRPRVQNCSLLLPNLYPLANAAEILNGDTAPGAFSCSNDQLRYYVIRVRGKALFFARKFVQATICRSRVKLLKFST